MIAFAFKTSEPHLMKCFTDHSTKNMLHYFPCKLIVDNRRMFNLFKGIVYSW